MINTNKKILCTIIIGLFCSSLMAIETKKEQSKSKDGEPISTFYYKSEPDEMIKRVLYGTVPKYRLMQLFFEKNSSNYIEHQDFFGIEFGFPDFPLGKPDVIITYFRNDYPTEISRLVARHESGKIVKEYFYKKDNKLGIDFTRSWNDPDGIPLLFEGYYLNVKENTEHIKEYRETYENNLAKLEQIIYYQRLDFLIKKISQYLPPEFTQKDNKPWKIASDYQDEPEGLMRIEQENLTEDRRVVDYQYDWNKNPSSYSKIVHFYKADKLIKRELYYGRPFEGGIWTITVEVNPDDSKTIKWWDAKGNEIPRKQ